MRLPTEVNERYEMFLSDIKSTDMVYSAIDESESFAAWSYDEGDAPLVLFWSRPEFVQEAIESQFNGYGLCEITTDDFCHFLQDLEKQGYFIAVNWFPEMVGLEVNPSALLNKILLTNQ